MSTSANRPVVFDLGSAYIKCGFAGEASPRYVLASPLGELRAREPPLEPSEWAMELGALFSALFFRRLQTRPKDRQVLVCETGGAGGAGGGAEAAGLREGIATALLEQLHVACVCIAPCGLLALLPSGFTTGVALDVGWREARVTAVYDGLLLRHAARSVGGGAARVQMALRRRLAAAVATEEGGEGEGEGEGGLPLPPPTEAELEDMVVRACFVLPRAEAAAAAAAGAATDGGVAADVRFPAPPGAGTGTGARVLPGGTRSRVAECLFGEGGEWGGALDDCHEDGDGLPPPAGNGDDAAAAATGGEGCCLARALLETLLACPLDTRRALAQNVVVAGGAAMLPGLCARLREEAVAIVAASKAEEGAASCLGTYAARYAPLAPLFAPAVLSGGGARGGGDGSDGVATAATAAAAAAAAAGTFQVRATQFPRSTLAWLGASLLGAGGGARLEAISLTRAVFRANGGRLRDACDLRGAALGTDAPLPVNRGLYPKDADEEEGHA